MNPAPQTLAPTNWRYRRWGAGRNLWIALHGYDQDGSIFAGLAAVLPPGQVLYALDLPGHGATPPWSEPLKPETLVQAIEVILAQENSRHYSALGFSFGARLWLGLMAQESYRWQALFLLSPDGIRTRWLSALDRVPRPWRQSLFEHLGHPAWFLRLAKWGHRLRLMDYFSWRFLLRHLGEPTLRQRLAAFWVWSSYFTPPRLRTLQQLAQRQVMVGIVWGERDFVVSPAALKRWMRQLPQLHTYPIAEAGHWVLRHRLSPSIFANFAAKIKVNTSP